MKLSAWFTNLEQKEEKLAAGLMSGTSLDGVDAALISVKGSGTETAYELKKFITFPFPDGIKERILENAETGGGNVTALCELNAVIALIYADAVKQLASEAGVALEDIDFIGSHGQTVHHLPEPAELFGYTTGSTLQIGDPAVLAKHTGILTVGDFRTGDTALGGQGAPLVPHFDYIMFHSPDKNRALLNIGGISNITVLDRNGTGAGVIAFDTGPGNMLIDTLSMQFFGKPFDKDGAIAESGKVNSELLEALVQTDEFLPKSPPKSSGREYYGKYFLPKLLERFASVPHEDWLATVATYTAAAVYENYSRFIQGQTAIEELFVSGGGARNPYLVKQLQQYFGNAVSVRTVDALGIDSDAKEAVCFAILANETLAGLPSNIPNVTGASKHTILGKICLP